MNRIRQSARVLWVGLLVAWLAMALFSISIPAAYAQDGGDPPAVVDDPGQVDDDGEPTAITLQSVELSGDAPAATVLPAAGLALTGLTLLYLGRGRISRARR